MSAYYRGDWEDRWEPGTDSFEDMQGRSDPMGQDTHEYMSPELWVTKEGERIPITEMTNQHLLNCVTMLERANRDDSRIYQQLLAELDTRIF